MANNNQGRSKGIGFGRILLYITVLSIGGVIFFNYYKNNVQDYTFIPEEMQLTYVPSDFKFDADDENVLAILNNPHRYHREFDELVYKFNLSLIHHVANRMDFPDSLKMKLETEYQKHHPYLKQLYFTDFVNIRDTTGSLYETWYENGNMSAVEALNEVGSKYSCFFVNFIITTLLKVDNGLIGAKGRKIDTPCGIAMTEGLRPLIKRLQNKAAILDFAQSKGLMEERVEKTISELGTFEVRNKKGLSKQLQTKVLGFKVSSTDVEVSAISILKIGFKLDQYFNITLSEQAKTITVTLPEPSILSHEVYPKIDKLDIGWLRELQDSDLNANFNILRREFRNEAFDNDAISKSKQQAREIMNMIFAPILSTLKAKYQLVVKFKNINPTQEPVAEIDQAPSKQKIEAPF
ncbi:MAG: hypothetical protein ACI81W_002382 [Saprospiraceae bacterium]|jgi:hypothetical protein